MAGRYGIGDIRLVAAVILMLCAVLPIGATEFEKWLIMPGEVITGHADIEADCELCHSPLTDVPQAELCVDCHTNVGEDLALSWGLHGKLAEQGAFECTSCHLEHEGRDQAPTTFDHDAFDHSITDFGLHGLHVDVDCAGCHEPDEAFHAAPSDCAGCHRSDDVHGPALDIECGACHIAGGWQYANFDHTLTAFHLIGAHMIASCDSCHASKDFTGAGDQCIDCHLADDVHEGKNGAQCGECHDNSSWKTVDFDHFAVTGFALTRGHGGLACADCHTQPDHSGLAGSSCNSCHASDDVHEGRFGTRCDTCHTTASWNNARFDHLQRTGFALPDGHGSLACDSCHSGALSDPLPVDCAGCHRDDDPHRGQLGDDCESCHVPSSWDGQLWFDHDITAFPLLGAHAGLGCASCHESAAFHDADPACSSCHTDDDPHKGSLGDRCGACHGTTTWRASSFDHDVLTNFPLTGAHAQVSCSGCHADESQPPTSLPTDCNACHRRDDPHNGRFGNNCESCHNTSTFQRVEGLR